ncbi:hypothetical protein BDU57DRAFT_544093 [Ampelomyces quisqualis]|uniref:RanBP2-type domain-containing protein n=1 Tax=Ampelomyces quisqualis TaxID=50730 RepID=A0A6A5QZV7_AMPQU|nr:hypothetical protein BDU57DRAFT_544093 [Ampelomyces quisqualis]
MSAPAFGVLVDTEDTRRIYRLTAMGRHLTKDEFEEAEQLAEQFRKEVLKNPRKIHMYRYAYGRLEATKEEADRLSEDHRVWSKEITAKKEAKAERDKIAADESYQKRIKTDKQKQADDQVAVTKPVEAETTSAPSKGPPILPTSAQAMPKPPDDLPPEAIPGPQQTKKRAAQDASAMGPPPKKTKYQRAAGDWKCGKCGWWNQRIWISCHLQPRTANKPCGAAKKDPSIKHRVQKETLEVKIRKSGALWFGDWRCGPCRKWNNCDLKSCRICGMSKAECQDAEEKDDQELDLPHWYSSPLTSNDYWYGDSRGPTASTGNQHSDYAAYLGVKGRFKEKKNPYRER